MHSGPEPLNLESATDDFYYKPTNEQIRLNKHKHIYEKYLKQDGACSAA